MNIEEVLQDLDRAKTDAEYASSAIMSLTNDLLFVFYELENGLDVSGINEWFFENDIISKYETITINHPVDGYFSYNFGGYRFKDAESAIAFKLRWT